MTLRSVCADSGVAETDHPMARPSRAAAARRIGIARVAPRDRDSRANIPMRPPRVTRFDICRAMGHAEPLATCAVAITDRHKPADNSERRLSSICGLREPQSECGGGSPPQE